MFLLNPQILDQEIRVMVRLEKPVYDYFLINQSTKEKKQFTPIATFNEGILKFNLPESLIAKTFYILLIYSNNVLMNYSLIYSDTDVEQRYRAIENEFKIPDEDTPEYIMG